MRRPFIVYKETLKTGQIWYARFWDDSAQKYKHSRSTGIKVEGKKERKHEAEEAARKLSLEIAQLQTVAVKKRQRKTADTPFIQYLRNFWTPESEYARFKRDVEKNPLSLNYIHMNYEDIRRHVEPFPGFEEITLGELNKGTLKKYLIWLAGRKKQTRKKDGTITLGDPISGRRANVILQAIRVAVRWAVDNDELPTDPFRKLGDVTDTPKEKGVLTLEERNKLINSPITHHKHRLAMLLGCLCGMRRGEMRGLQWGDIENDIIHIRHNYIDREEEKKPKHNSVRKVPLPTAVKEVLEMVYTNADNTSPDSFVFESPVNKDKPMSSNFFRETVKKELLSIGISEAEQTERFITPHSLRHTFITLAQITGVPDVVISALAGHKSLKTTARYSHVPQVIDFAETKKQIDGSYLPLRTG